jgi:hypothetical protein
LPRAAALTTALAAVLMAEPAPAAIWRWACQGETGDQRIILFGRDGGLYISGSSAPAGMPAKVTADSIREAADLAKTSSGFTVFDLERADDELASRILVYARTDENKQEQKVTLTVRSSKLISHKHAMIACRNEDTDLYRKVYRYKRDGEPARDITMQCMEYQLSTKGGRRDCD